MPTLRTLTGDLDDFLGGESLPGVKVYIEHNLPEGQAVVDTTNNKVRLGKRKQVSLTGTAFTITGLFDTSSTDLNVEANTLQYQVVAEYRGEGNRPSTWKSGWFALTANSDLADLATDANPMVAQAASAILDQIELISGLTGEDAAVAALAGNSGSQFRQTLDPVLAATDALRQRQAAERAGAALMTDYNGRGRMTLPIALGALASASAASGLETNKGTVTFTGTTFTLTGHGLTVGQRVRFANKTGGSFLNGNPYYVSSVPDANTFTVYASNGTSGGNQGTGSNGDATLYANVPLTEYAYVRGWDTVAITASNDQWATTKPHGLAVGDTVSVTGSTAGGVANNTKFYVKTVPSATTFTVSAVVRGTTLDVTGDGTAALGLVNPKMMVRDGRAVQVSTSSPQWDFVKTDLATITYAPGTPTGGEVAVVTWIDGDRFEILAFNDGAANLRVYADDVQLDTITPAQLTAAGITTGTVGARLYTFAAARPRKITIRSEGPIAGVRVPVTTNLSKPTDSLGARWAFVGDSFTEGTGAANASQGGYVSWVRRLLNLDTVRAGSGGTGVITAGPTGRPALIDRYAADILNQGFDSVMLALGINDDNAGQYTANPAAFVTAYETVVDAILAAGLNLAIISTFPNGGGTGVGANFVAMDEDIREIAAARNVPCFSPIADGLTFTRADTTHPDDAGHKKIGKWVAGWMRSTRLA